MEKALESMPNKNFAYSCLQLLIIKDKLDSGAINILTDEDECLNDLNVVGNLQYLRKSH